MGVSPILTNQNLYKVGAQQNLHFEQLFKILDLMGHAWGKTCEHINFGMVLGMSTRQGTVTFLSEILEAARETMLKRMQDPKNEEKLSQIEDPEKTAVRSISISLICLL